ncbi:rod shape-determining protein MreC [Erythrobacter sp. WG]|uniref:rod shape-determining protein MreC n=1 Tax=Erythrobacter sp. WG TaxID=2985510 RepID=UPI0022717429|nr:rod shape-determining protein MreC [Erythrobacter sp. WG]MCX9146173.1 rod shape-determining protein MreC [Erythrobacter sp. WG]
MAPPSSRRSGFSKKAQYSLFTGYLLAGAGALLGLGLLALSLWQPAAFAPVRGVASDAVAPVGSATAAARAGSQGVFEAIAGYFNAGRQNAELRREVEIARIRLAEAEGVKAENARLRGLLGLNEGTTRPIAVARLVGTTATSGRRHAYVNAGASDGVAPGMPVLSERGVIGRVLETGRSSARVLLLTDSESVLPVRRAADNVIAFAEGRGDGLLRIRLVNLGVNPLKVGDVMVTSGAGGYYRPGVAVAVIAKLTPDGGIGQLVAEPGATNYVAIEPIAQAAAVAALEAPERGESGSAATPRPQPAPSASPSPEALETLD